MLTWRPEPLSSPRTRRATSGRAPTWISLGSRVELPSHTTLELGAAWRASSWLEPYARVENLFDESYEEAAGFPAPGRTLVGGVALNF